MSNMELWRSVEVTDPAMTKRVNQRGGFTSIGAHYQVMRATETFGPVGTGWGYDCGAPIFHGDFIIIPVILWYRDRGNTFGPVYGCAEFVGKRPDHDAPKKAMTDALTKALSHLGFNADVFLGKFDDNKYVADLTKAKHAEAAGSAAEDAKAKLMACGRLDHLQAVWKGLSNELRAMPEVEAVKDVRKTQLTEQKDAA